MESKPKQLQGHGGVTHRLLIHPSTINAMKAIQNRLAEATGVSPSNPVVLSRAIEMYHSHVKHSDELSLYGEIRHLRSIAKG